MATKSPWEQVAENARELKTRAEAALADVEVTQAADALTKAATQTVDSIRSGEAYRAAADQVARGVDSAKRAGVKFRETIESVTGPLKEAADTPDDVELITDRFEALLTRVQTQLDRDADAVSIGFLGEGGAGLAQMRGTEILYVPGRRLIRVNEVSGRAFRLAVGVAGVAYVNCFYGADDTLSQPMLRKGVDVDVLVTSIGFFNAKNEFGEPANGWMAALGAGLDIAVPVLGEITAFEVTDSVLGKHRLDRQRAAALDELIAGAPDRAIRRRIARAL